MPINPYQYQQVYAPQQYAAYPYQQQTAQQSPLIWVQGEAGAKSYMVAPGATVTLWDSEAQVIYLKSADASGMPSIRVIDYTFRDNAPMQKGGQDYATKAELEDLRRRLEEIAKREAGGNE